MAIQTNDSCITLVAGEYPLFVNGEIVGGIGVGGGNEEQDCTIAEYVVSVFEELTKQYEKLINQKTDMHIKTKISNEFKDLKKIENKV